MSVERRSGRVCPHKSMFHANLAKTLVRHERDAREFRENEECRSHPFACSSLVFETGMTKNTRKDSHKKDVYEGGPRMNNPFVPFIRFERQIERTADRNIQASSKTRQPHSTLFSRLFYRFLFDCFKRFWFEFSITRDRKPIMQCQYILAYTHELYYSFIRAIFVVRIHSVQ